ncbi:hypothetical protein KR49_08540 [Synechococcus sp. KORDI-49]|nr:hypothetical protein KR49_08540 [Synechococcus sp. KORDI-49]
MKMLLNKKNTDACFINDALDSTFDIKNDRRLNPFSRFV